MEPKLPLRCEYTCERLEILHASLTPLRVPVVERVRGR